MKELIVKVDDSGTYHIEGELIRCEDCKYYKDGVCKDSWYDDPDVPKDGFCYLAERCNNE